LHTANLPFPSSGDPIGGAPRRPACHLSLPGLARQERPTLAGEVEQASYAQPARHGLVDRNQRLEPRQRRRGQLGFLDDPERDIAPRHQIQGFGADSLIGARKIRDHPTRPTGELVSHWLCCAKKASAPAMDFHVSQGGLFFLDETRPQSIVERHNPAPAEGPRIRNRAPVGVRQDHIGAPWRVEQQPNGL